MGTIDCPHLEDFCRDSVTAFVLHVGMVGRRLCDARLRRLALTCLAAIYTLNRPARQGDQGKYESTGQLTVFRDGRRGCGVLSFGLLLRTPDGRPLVLSRLCLSRLLLISLSAMAAMLVGIRATLAFSGTLDFGAPTSVTITTAGEIATFTFSGTAGQRVSIGITSVALTPSQGSSGASLKVYKPDGTLLSSTSFGNGGADFDVSPLPVSGTYTITVTPGSSATGSFTITLSTPAAGPSTLNSSVPVTISYPAQDTLFSFSGTVGQRVSIGVSSVSLTPALGINGGIIYVYNPDGSELTHFYLSGNGEGDVAPLPTTGTYTVRVDTGISTGSYTVSVSTPAAGPTSINSSVPVTISYPAQDSLSTFNGSVGESVRISVSSISVTPSLGINGGVVYMYNPDGSQFAHFYISGNGHADWGPLATAGTYTVRVDTGISTGTYQVLLQDLSVVSLATAPASDVAQAQFVRPHECLYQNQISTATGSYADTWTDLQLPGVGGGLGFARSYRSTSLASSPLGNGWTHPYLARLRLDSTEAVYLILPDGRNVSFTLQPDGSYLPLIPGMGTLVASNGTFTFTDKDRRVFTFNSQGNLTNVADRNGVTTTITPDGQGRPSTVTDAAGRTLQFTYNPSGQLASVSGPDNMVVSYTYGSNGQLASATLPGNLVWRYGSDASGRINQVTDPDGIVQTAKTYDGTGRVLSQDVAGGTNHATFTYDDTNHAVTATDSAGQTITDTYDSKGEPLSCSVAGGGATSTWSYTYDSAGNQLAATDPNSHATNSSYDQDGNVLTRTDALGRTWTFTYDAQDRLLTATDPRGGLTTNTYDSHGNLLKAVTSLDATTSATTSYTYDSRGLVLTRTDPDNSVTTLTYDTVGNLTQVQDPLNRTTSMTYDARSRMVSKTDALGAQTTLIYDAGNRMTSKTLDATGLALTTTYTYDGRGDVLSSTDPLQHTTTFTYTPRGKLASQTDPLNHTTTYTYDAHGNRTSVTDPNTHTGTLAYDPLDRLVSATDPLNGIQRFTYDAAGNRLMATDQNNHQTTYTYDAGNQLVQVTGPTGGTTSFSYDGVGNRISSTDPNNHTTAYTYDLAKRLTAEADALGNTWQSVYDAAGHRTHLKDAKNQDTAFTYDAAGQLAKITDPLNGSVSFGYDAVGNRTSITDPNNHITTFGFDKVGRPISETDPLNDVWQSSYDAAGHIIRVLDAKNQTTALSYDAVGHLLQVTYADNSSVQYTYDAAGNRVSMVDPTGTTSWAYDALNRISSVTQPVVGQVSYGYDAASNRTSVALPGGNTVTYAYDSASRLASVTDAGQRTSSFTYDAAGNPLTTNLPNGVQRRYSYDTANRLLGIEHWVGGSEIEGVDYTLDPNGNRLTANQLVAAPAGGGASLSRTVSYTYDALNRLTGATYTDGASTEGYTYDAAGNRLSATIGGTVTGYTYDAANRLVTAGADSYTYDANGNTLTAGSRTYSWDAANRMASVTTAPDLSPITYAYNGDGLRISRTTQGQTTILLQDLAASLSVVLRETGPTGAVDYTWANGLLSQQDTTGYYTPLGDGIGSVQALANSQGQVAASFTYDAFGNPQGTPGGTTTTSYHFAGEQTDPTAGLINLRARTYDPRIGRFLSRDSLITAGQFTQGFNRYTYVENNPIGRVDPTGHWDLSTYEGRQAARDALGAGYVIDATSIYNRSSGVETNGTGSVTRSSGVTNTPLTPIANPQAVAQNFGNDPGAIPAPYATPAVVAAAVNASTSTASEPGSNQIGSDSGGVYADVMLPGSEGVLPVVPCASYWSPVCVTGIPGQDQAKKQVQANRMTLTLQLGIGVRNYNNAVGVNDSASGIGVTGSQVMDAIPTLYALGQAGGRVTQAALNALAAAQLEIAMDIDGIIVGNGYLGAKQGLINVPLADGWRFELDANYGYNLRQW